MTRNTGRLGVGILIGSLVAMGATVAQRELMRRAGTRLIDWENVRGIARRRLGPHAAPLSAREREEAQAFYRTALKAIEPSIQAEVGRPLPRLHHHHAPHLYVRAAPNPRRRVSRRARRAPDAGFNRQHPDARARPGRLS